MITCVWPMHTIEMR